MRGQAIVAGGSIGGLFAAAALRKAGWTVEVCERVGVELAGRGAGIVTHPQLIAALAAVGAGTEALGVEVTERVAFDKAGEVVMRHAYPQVVTSWDRIHSGLRRLLPDAAHRLGQEVTGYRNGPESVTVGFRDGSTREVDLLVGADGFRSAVRAQMLPGITPDYSGYVVWRALTREADIAPDVYAQLFEAFGVYAPRGTQIIGYPIAGPGNDLRPGHRRYNFVWYARVPPEALENMLTDATGQRHQISIPPPLVRDEVLAEMEADAAARLPAPFVSVLAASERPFFTPIYDHHSPRMADSRVALAGDAACVARPHVGMGVTKAAADALALVRHLDGAASVEAALTAYSDERTAAARAAYDRARRLGAFIFDAGAPGNNPDGRSNPNLPEIMELTASADF